PGDAQHAGVAVITHGAERHTSQLLQPRSQKRDQVWAGAQLTDAVLHGGALAPAHVRQRRRRCGGAEQRWQRLGVEVARWGRCVAGAASGDRGTTARRAGDRMLRVAVLLRRGVFTYASAITGE